MREKSFGRDSEYDKSFMRSKELLNRTSDMNRYTLEHINQNYKDKGDRYVSGMNSLEYTKGKSLRLRNCLEGMKQGYYSGPAGYNKRDSLIYTKKFDSNSSGSIDNSYYNKEEKKRRFELVTK